MLTVSDFDYVLPERFIAKRPLPNRSASRMMVIDRSEESITHRQFTDFPSYLGKGDRVVLNNTRVVPARLCSHDGKIEIVRVEQLGENLWRCVVRPGKKFKQGASIHIGGAQGVVEEVLASGERVIQFDREISMHREGELALPPYMDRQSDEEDQERYQTVYGSEEGAIAAPTAGLHFTRPILESIAHTFITLHVGLGTFQPVRGEKIAEHPMHREDYFVDVEASTCIAQSHRVVAVGTTVVRVLEHLYRTYGKVKPGHGQTDIFIYPPYQFKVVDALLTNFHLPKSTLLMLVSAFMGIDLAKRAYREAIEREYRFYSYGDCMLIV